MLRPILPTACPRAAETERRRLRAVDVRVTDDRAIQRKSKRNTRLACVSASHAQEAISSLFDRSQSRTGYAQKCQVIVAAFVPVGHVVLGILENRVTYAEPASTRI